MLSSPRFVVVSAAVLLASAGPIGACAPPPPTPLALPSGLPLDALSPAQRGLLRATLAVDGGALSETDVVLDAETLQLSGDVALDNVAVDGAHVATLRVYGRVDAASAETLFGEATAPITVEKNAAAFLDFGDSVFESCGAGVDGVCGLRFDDNRNGRSNVDDVVAGVDAAPPATFVATAPQFLQFGSGVRAGAFARQVVVVENDGDTALRVERVQVIGGQGVGVSVVEPGAVDVAAPRRRLDGALDKDGDGVSDFVVAAGDEAFVAVSFAPVNGFLTSAAVQIVASDVVSGVRQSTRTVVVANADGALRPRDPAYVEPDLSEVDLGAGGVAALAFPGGALFNGAEVASVGGAAGLARSGAAVVVDDGDGVFAMAADAAFAVNVAAGTRFAASLAQLESDVDLAVLDVSSGDAVLVGASRQQGTSAEAVDADLSDVDRVLVVVLGRVEKDPPPAVAGGLAAAARVPFGLTCQLTRGPEIDDVDPIAPAHGPVEGGVPVVVHGRGFYDGDNVVVRVDGVRAVGDAVVATAADGAQAISFVLPPGSFAAGDTAVTVVVENPLDAAALADGADGQAATLAEGFRYDLPSPRLNAIAPDSAPTTGGDVDLAVTGAFFFDTYGAPVVAFDDIDVDAVFVDAAHLTVRPPPHAAGLASVRVKNRLRDGSLGAPSALRPLFYVTPTLPAPTVDAIDVDEGSADGGTVVVVSGSNFAAGARVFFGADAAVVDSVADSTISVRTPRVDGGGLVDVIVQNGDGQAARLAGAFTFVRPPPAIGSVFPARAPAVGSSLVIVDGSGFVAGASVSFSNGADVQPSPFVDVRSSSELLLRTPASFSAGPATLTLTNPDGQSTSTTFTFFDAVDAPPRLVAVDPQSGDVSGGDVVILTGSGLVAPVTVLFGDVIIADLDVVAVANGLQQVQVTAPAGSAGPALVTLINPDGQSAAIAFTYVDVGDPRVVALSPATVHAQVLGDELLVFGQNLSLLGAPVTAAAVTGNGRVALGVVAVADTLARLVVDGGVLRPGAFRVELRGPSGAALSSTTATARLPNVVSADIDAGTGDLLLIGDNLAGDRLVRVVVGGVDCAGVVADERLIQCRLAQAPLANTISLFYAGRAVAVVDNFFTVDGGAGEGEGEGEGVLEIVDLRYVDGQRIEVSIPGLRAADFVGVQNTVVSLTGGASADFPVIIDTDDVVVIDDARGLPPLVVDVRLFEARTVRALGQGLSLTPLPLIDVEALESFGKGQLTVIGGFAPGAYTVRLTSNDLDAAFDCALDDGTRMFCFAAAPGDDVYRVRVFDADSALVADDIVVLGGGGGVGGCGDGFVEAGEACDDGNANDADGCDSGCRTSPCRGDARRSGFAPDGTCVAVYAIEGSWLDAERACESRGGHLAAPRDSARNNFVRALAETFEAVWIGVEDFSGEAFFDGGSFHLVDGGRVRDAFFAFNPGEPNGDFSESCAEIVGGGAGWNDLTCGSLEPQFACEFEQLPCGDGVRQPGEGCDDGNGLDGDGCDAGCNVEVGFACGGRHSQCAAGAVPPTCGDGVVDEDEACDDGDRDDGDGCDSACASTGCAPNARRSTNDPITGQCFGVFALTLNWIDAESFCEAEGGHLAAPRDVVTNDLIVALSDVQNDIWLGLEDFTAESFTNPLDWRFVNGGTVRDTGFSAFRPAEPNSFFEENCLNAVHGGWNDLSCAALTVEQFACEFDVDGPCGNGVINPGESCDDKNNNEGDGCDPGCQVEPGFLCNGRPSVCVGDRPPGCGDGFVAANEDCDDGNDVDDDGCSRLCSSSRCGSGFGASRSLSDPISGNCFMVFDVETDWFTAEAQCEGLNGHLAGIRDARTNDLLKAIQDDVHVTWIGVEDFTVESFDVAANFTVVGGGTTRDFNAFRIGEPNGFGSGEACVDDFKGDWNDFGCFNNEVTQFACELAADPCGDGVRQPAEGCDDANDVDGDGCDAACNVEAGFSCNGRLSVCVAD